MIFIKFCHSRAINNLNPRLRFHDLTAEALKSVVKRIRFFDRVQFEKYTSRMRHCSTTCPSVDPRNDVARRGQRKINCSIVDWRGEAEALGEETEDNRVNWSVPFRRIGWTGDPKLRYLVKLSGIKFSTRVHLRNRRMETRSG